MIRKAVIEDAERLGEIHVFGWRSAYRNIVSDQYLFTKLSVAKRISSFKKTLEEGIEENYVYEDAGIIKGFMTIGKCRNEDKQNAFELWGIYIDPCFKRNGIGKQLVEYCENEAKSRGFSENALWVFKVNHDAKIFYEKTGYKTDGKEEKIEYFNAIEERYIKLIK